MDRAIHLIALQNSPHFGGRCNDTLRMAHCPAGKGSHRGPSPPLAWRKVMGIILINRVVRMNNGCARGCCQPLRHHKGGKLTLGVDDIRLPGLQLPQQLHGRGSPQTGAGIDHPRADGTDVSHISLPTGVGRLGQGQYPDLMTLGSQLPFQIQNRGHHAVDGRCVPIGCDQNFQRTHLLFFSVLSVLVQLI